MILSEFVLKWNGKYCEVAGSANAQNQCVDLANAYLRDVLNLPIVEWTNAIDFPSKLTEKFDYILNTPTGVPQEGDMMISGVSYGHIGIFLEGDANHFYSFDENYPTGSFCTVVEHNYDSPKVHGWLRLKSSTTVAVEASVFENLVRKSSLMDKVAQMLNKEALESIIVPDVERLIKLEDALSQKNKQLEEANIKISSLDIEIDKLTKANIALTETNGILTTKVEDQKIAIKEQEVKIGTINEQVTQLKKDCQPSTPALTGFKKWIYDTFIK